MRRSLAWLIALTAAFLFGALAPAAYGHPDPAGEFLTTQRVFVSYDAHVPSAAAARLDAAVASANRQGFDIRVALIWRRSDLGKVPKFWRKPGAYADFMYGENTSYFKGARLLVLMPNGFGFAWQKHPTGPAYRILSGVRTGSTAAELTEAAVAGVQRLAAADGVHVTDEVASQNNRDRVEILVGVAVLLLAGALIRRRRPRRLTVQRP
jgi:hypothetical protein